MSRIYFHAFDETAEVLGKERAHFGVMCANIGWGALHAYASDYARVPSILRQLFPKDHYVITSPGNFEQMCETYFRISMDTVLFEGEPIGIFALNLNTALRMGSDPVKLAARLHGQCEIHAYVEGPNRKWLAGIIRKGREYQIFRDGCGWEDVIDLLEKANDSPMVTSYSVCDRFPNLTVADLPVEDEDLAIDTWDAMPGLVKWQLAMEGLRKKNKISELELKPEGWESYSFDHELCANQLIAVLLAKETKQ